MAKLKLNPEPTFKAKVKIPVPGSAPVPVEFTFKHKSRTELREWLEVPQQDRPEAEYVRQFVAGWELDDEFNDANIERLCDSYPGAGVALLEAYLDEMRGARAKN